MKHFNFILFFGLLLVACDTNEFQQDSESILKTSDYYQRQLKELPFNSENTFDIAGQVYSDIFNSYYDVSPLPIALDSIIALVDMEMSEHDYFDALPNFDYHQFSVDYIDSIIKQPSARLTVALDASILSTTVRSSFETFLSDLFLKIDIEEDYEFIYDFIIAYETAILNDKNLSVNESEFILTVTSIARHSVYNKEKKPKPNTDPDWDWLTTCIVGSVDGAVYSAPESIAMALKTGIGVE
jgi:hypothetical protein